ncbi:glycosyltransferase [Luteimonas sp. A482]
MEMAKTIETDTTCQKRILLFISSMNCGGAERVAILLASAMTGLGSKVWLVVCRNEGEFLRSVPEGVELVSLECGKPIRGTKKLAALVSEISPDAVIAFGIYAGIAAAISKVRAGWPPPLLIRNESNISVEWTYGGLHNRIIGPALSRFAARHSKVICVSQALHGPTARFLRVPESEIDVIPNPVIPALLPSHGWEDLHPWLRQKPAPTFVAMGRLEPQKDFDTLLRALRIARNQMNCRLIIFGEGSLRSDLNQTIHSLDLTDCVDMPGVTGAPLLQMQHASAFVLSSRYEGFGLVLVEALFARTAVISTNCDYGPSEVLENGRFGTLVPVGDALALAEAMVDVANGTQAHDAPDPEWFEKFRPEVAARKHLQIVRELCSSS